MKIIHTYRNVAVMIFIIVPAIGKANNDHPYPQLIRVESFMRLASRDTLPDSKKNPDEIKEVPKSHKQLKPVAVPIVAIKPVVKPKVIIKPAIKIH